MIRCVDFEVAQPTVPWNLVIGFNVIIGPINLVVRRGLVAAAENGIADIAARPSRGSAVAPRTRPAPSPRRPVIAVWLGHESIETTNVYLHANLAMKEKALAKIQPMDTPFRRFRPDDRLLAFLESL